MKPSIKTLLDTYIHDNKRSIISSNQTVAEYILADAEAQDQGWLWFLSEEEIVEFENATSERRNRIKNKIIDFVNENCDYSINKTIYLLENYEEEIVRKTIKLFSKAFNCSGMFIPNIAFTIDLGDDGIVIDHYPFVDNRNHSDNVFMSIDGNNIPKAIDYGYDNLEDVDWFGLGYDEYIKEKINQQIMEYNMLNEK